MESQTPLLLLLFLLLSFTAILCQFYNDESIHGCTTGDIRLIGSNSTCSLIGRLNLCYQSNWRLVCHGMWDRDDAKVVCRQFGFPEQGALSCTDSCFGGDDETLPGLYNFQCIGNEESLINCNSMENNKCGKVAGVICLTDTGADDTLYSPTPTPVCECPTPSDCTDPDSGSNRTAIGASLGGVAAGLMLALISVVMGWVWTCYRNRYKYPATQQRGPQAVFHNPTYTQTTPLTPPTSNTIPSTCYSSQGPRDTPTNHTSQPSSEHACHPEREEREGEAVYEVLEDTQGEAVYHVLEDTRGGGGERDGGENYEVPTQSSPNNKGERIAHTQGKEEMEYSTLQHL